MAYGLIIKNASGTTVINTATNILNFETLDTTNITVAASGSTTVTVPDAHIPDTILVDVDGFGAEDITSASGINQITFTNGSTTSRSVNISFWRLR